MNNEDYLIGLDLGTSSIKGILINSKCKVLYFAQESVKYLFPCKNQIEADPEVYYQTVCKVIRKLSKNISDNSQIRAVSFAAASGNTLIIDKTGKPSTNIISWLDNRLEGIQCKTLSKLHELPIYEKTGWPPISIFPLAHLSWLKENKTYIYQNAKKFCMNNDFITYRLTGKWELDTSTAGTFYLQDQIKKEWYKEALNILEIYPEQLSTINSTGSVLGKLTDQASLDTGLSEETKVVLGSFDHPAAARAAGIFNESDMLLSCGTSWVGFLPVTNRKNAIKNNLLVDDFLSSTEKKIWGAMFSIPNIGSYIDDYVNFVNENFNTKNQYNKYDFFEILASKLNTENLKTEIDFYSNSEIAKDKLFSLKPEQICKSIIIEAAMLLKYRISELINNGYSINKIVMVGGPAKSRIWVQTISDILNLPVYVNFAVQHTGAVGAAIIAGIGMNLFKSEQEAQVLLEKNNSTNKDNYLNKQV